MNSTHRKTPAWGGFKGSAGNGPSENSDDVSFYGVTVLDRMIDGPDSRDAPAFNVHVSLNDDASPEAFLDRNEEEYDDLGEGAIRQISRNFASIVGTGSTFAMLAAFAIWIAPSDKSSVVSIANADLNLVSEERVDASNLETKKVIEVALKQDFFVSAEDNSPSLAEQEPSGFVEIQVELPIPVIVEAVKMDEAPLASTRELVFDASGFPGPIPIAREYALNTLAGTEIGIIAQGSDDERTEVATSEVLEAAQAREWVSVMIPRSRPLF
jgi:hypothetical protein